MRFIANGPIVPDQLLESRDDGRVVFLCGAGVSIPSTMPSFADLTRHVVETFDPSENSPIARAFQPWERNDDALKTPLDQIFNCLHQEYGRDEVNELVADRLNQSKEGSEVGHEHRLIVRISADQEGNPQIVTTNFDRLFELALDDRKVDLHVAPALPGIEHGAPITGITYLHGRLAAPDDNNHNYVLSSADFGRAYLSEAWATTFVRHLLDRYTVVLVGYSAEDPPVRYLLEGLNNPNSPKRSNLYAFDRGRHEDIEVKWRDRGVTPIAYSGDGRDHTVLWETLAAWADRADDPRCWRNKTIDLARRGPRDLESHERGRVAHLVRTNAGARLFATADPAPNPEWLCVFDARCRAAKPAENSGQYFEAFDPLETYGLDDDPPRPPENGHQTGRIHDHLLEWRSGDTNPSDLHRLGGQPEGRDPLPSRLLHLCNWVAGHLNSPVAAWWAFRQNGLHPHLLDLISRQLRQSGKLDPEAKRIWNFLIEYQSDRRNFTWDSGWFDLRDRIEKEGWTPSVLRDFEYSTAPKLKRSWPYGLGKAKPPFGAWDSTKTEEITRLEVEFPDLHGQTIEIPEDALALVFATAERHLLRASRMLKELRTYKLKTPTCYPGRNIDGEEQDRKADGFFAWFLSLFDRLIASDSTRARSHAQMWPKSDPYFFRKLSLFARNQSALFDGRETAEFLLGFEQESFWDTEVRRELLFLINDRWHDFDNDDSANIIDRVLAGPDRASHWSDEEYAVIRNKSAARYAKWLAKNGCEFVPDRSEKLAQIISTLPDWNDLWASSIVVEQGVHVGWVGVDETPDIVADLPDNKVIERVKSSHERDFSSFTERQPFTGLVKENPRKALAALSIEAKKGDYPETCWSALICEWPETVCPRLQTVFLKRLQRLPHATIREIRHPVGRWIEQRFAGIFEVDQELAWETFDHLVDGLVSDNGNTTGSVISETRIGGEVVQSSRRTFGHAINSPLGMATEGLLNALNSPKFHLGSGLPELFSGRIERLLAVPGEGSDHAVSILTKQIKWLHAIDPKWVMGRLVPLFALEHPAAEPAWNGFLSSAQLPVQEVWLAIKDIFLGLFPHIYGWMWDHELSRTAAQMVALMTVFRSLKKYGLTENEARRCLREMSDNDRNNVIHFLGGVGKNNEDGWKNLVIPFVSQVWPREQVYRTGASVSAWVSMLAHTGDDFPEVLNAARRFLVPVVQKSHWLYRFAREVGGENPLTEKHPKEVLEMLDAIVPSGLEDAPHELGQILELIEEVDPELTRDRRFFRLIDLVERR